MTDVFAPARAVADAVLYEGYVLYPYRASDAKNQVRWQWGVLVPPAYREHDPAERSFARTDCLLEGVVSRLRLRVRWLQVCRRTVEAPTAGGWAPVAALDVGDATHLPFDEAVPHESDVDVAVADCLRGPVEVPLSAPAAQDTEDLHHPNGTLAGRLVRERRAASGTLTLSCLRLPGPYGVVRLRADLANTTEAPDRADRTAALRVSLVAAHLLIAADGPVLSLLDPPEWARPYLEECDNQGTFPVLAGEPGNDRLVLSSPIILYDHPAVAPESEASFMDATEIDELLSLRTLTLTDEEKRQARGTDPRAAALIDHVEAMPPELVDRLHGAVRYLSAAPRRVDPGGTPGTPSGAVREAISDKVPGAAAASGPISEAFPGAAFTAAPELPPWWDPGSDASVSPETDEVVVAGTAVRQGSRVVLRPGRARADAQDMFLAGRPATVAAVLFDVDGGTHLAVTLDDDPEAAAVARLHGRFLYFAPDEIEPLTS